MSLQSIFTEVFSIPPDKVTSSLALRDIPSWDSMSHMTLIARVEEKFHVEFTGDEIADFRTFGDVKKALDERGVT